VLRLAGIAAGSVFILSVFAVLACGVALLAIGPTIVILASAFASFVFAAISWLASRRLLGRSDEIERERIIWKTFG
jgi:membrane protein implicated in regulation of membrane protease activity